MDADVSVRVASSEQRGPVAWGVTFNFRPPSQKNLVSYTRILMKLPMTFQDSG